MGVKMVPTPTPTLTLHPDQVRKVPTRTQVASGVGRVLKVAAPKPSRLMGSAHGKMGDADDFTSPHDLDSASRSRR